MHRWLVPLLLSVTFALAAVPSSAVAICPQSSSAGVPCCGPPTNAPDRSSGSAATCCNGGSTSCCAAGSTSCCAAGSTPCCSTSGTLCGADQLTIGSSPDPSTEGKPVTISGKLTPATAGQTVYLWQKLPGQSTFTRVAQATTDSAGAYSIVRGAGAVQENSSWYATAASATSATVVQGVKALVALSASPRKPHADKAVRFSGHVSPSNAGQRVLLQERTAKGWKTIATGKLGKKSKFTLHHKFARKGAVTLRVVLAGGSRNARSDSPAVKLSVG